ncbi:hypothetical protein MNV49_005130 [Pseudohyphozyma bogoriensis]|nr:hypothetical protein MNV49_005130 [Pseudohyphozyma bogoriensis]
MSNFESYASEWDQIKSSAQLKLADARSQVGEQKKATLRRITMELEEADEIIDQMEGEAKGKARQMIIVRSAKKEVQGLRGEVESTLSDRDALLSSSAAPAHSVYTIDVDESDTYTHTAAQRTRLLNSTSLLKTTEGRLTNAQRLAAESEDIGGNVLETLRGQGAQLANARDELEDTDGSISRATGTLKKMIRQMYKTRVMIWSFIVVLVILIGLILWNKFR